MKIRILRQSGLPVNLDDLNNYREKFRTLFDKAVRIAGKDMLRLNKKLVIIEKVLQKKYPTVSEVDLPKTLKGWRDLRAKYGNILVSQHLETEEILFVISDQEEVQY